MTKEGKLGKLVEKAECKESKGRKTAVFQLNRMNADSRDHRLRENTYSVVRKGKLEMKGILEERWQMVNQYFAMGNKREW